MQYLRDEILWGDPATTMDGQPVTGEVVAHDPNGTLVALVGYRDGIQDGPERLHYPDGSLKYEGEWTYGVAVGVHCGWYSNGQLREELFYENGALVSVNRWREDGTPVPRPSQQ